MAACSPQDDLDPFTGGFATQELCRSDNWCWKNAPLGSTLLSLYPVSESDIWAVGTQSPGVTDVSALSGSSAADIWGIPSSPGAGGSRVAAHYDGSAWTAVPLARSATAIFAISPADAVIADDGGCQRWNGLVWADAACGVPGAKSVWASSSTDIWVVGQQSCGDHCRPPSRRSHFDGTTWTMEETRDQYWAGVFGYAPNDVWINGSYHFDGQAWTQVTSCNLPQNYQATGATPGTLWARDFDGIKHFDGTAWTFSAMTHPWYPTMLGGPPGDVFIGDALGKVLQFDGTSFNTLRATRVQPYAMAYEGFGSSSSDIWSFDADHKLWHFDGTSWTFDGTGRVRMGWSRSPTDAIAWSETPGQGWHWNGSTWAPLDPIFGYDALTSAWGSAPDDVWVTGYRGSYPNYQGPIWHWDGTSWTTPLLDSQGYGYQIFGTGQADVFVAAGLHLLHYDGSGFSELLRDVTSISGGGSGPDDIWILGQDAKTRASFFRHWNGAVFTESQPLPMGGARFWGIPGVGTIATGYAGAIWLQRR